MFPILKQPFRRCFTRTLSNTTENNTKHTTNHTNTKENTTSGLTRCCFRPHGLIWLRTRISISRETPMSVDSSSHYTILLSRRPINQTTLGYIPLNTTTSMSLNFDMCSATSPGFTPLRAHLPWRPSRAGSWRRSCCWAGMRPRASGR